MTRPDWKASEIAALRETLEERDETIRQLRDALTPSINPPRQWQLTQRQERIMQALLSRDILRHEALMFILYGDRNDPPEGNILRVLVCQIRRKLAPFGVEIHSVWGVGWRLDRRAEWARHLYAPAVAPTLASPGSSAAVGMTDFDRPHGALGMADSKSRVERSEAQVNGGVVDASDRTLSEAKRKIEGQQT